MYFHDFSTKIVSKMAFFVRYIFLGFREQKFLCLPHCILKPCCCAYAEILFQYSFFKAPGSKLHYNG